jgi:hypothetical protein
MKDLTIVFLVQRIDLISMKLLKFGNLSDENIDKYMTELERLHNVLNYIVLKYWQNVDRVYLSRQLTKYQFEIYTDRQNIYR